MSCPFGIFQGYATGNKTMQAITVYKGDDSQAFGLRTIKIRLEAPDGIQLFRDATAKFSLLDFSKTFTNDEVKSNSMEIVLSHETTSAWTVGMVYGTFTLYDGEGYVLTASRRIPFNIKAGGIDQECDINSIVVDTDIASIVVSYVIDYANVSGKPKINGVEVNGDKTADEYGLATKKDLEEINTAARILPKYLHVINFSDSYWKDAKEYYKQFESETNSFGCSSFRCGKWYGRNYDWNYDTSATFVVRMKSGIDVESGRKRYASVGIASLGANLTEKMVESGNYTSLYRVIPGRTVDGINECGVFCNVNVVTSDERDGQWKGTSLCSMGAVRYVLDYFNNAYDAAVWISENIYLPKKFVKDHAMSFHYMVGDERETYIVEDGKVISYNLRSIEKTVMTNFRLGAGDFISDETGKVDRDKLAIIDPFGSGAERYDLLKESDLNGFDSCSQALEMAYFTKAYVDGSWGIRLSDFSSVEMGIKVNDDVRLRRYRDLASEAWKTATRDGTFWQTVHSSLYDVETRMLYLCVQEGEEERNRIAFTIPSISIATDERPGIVSGGKNVRIEGCGKVSVSLDKIAALCGKTIYEDATIGDIVKWLGGTVDKPKGGITINGGEDEFQSLEDALDGARSLAMTGDVVLNIWDGAVALTGTENWNVPNCEVSVVGRKEGRQTTLIPAGNKLLTVVGLKKPSFANLTINAGGRCLDVDVGGSSENPIIFNNVLYKGYLRVNGYGGSAPQIVITDSTFDGRDNPSYSDLLIAFNCAVGGGGDSLHVTNSVFYGGGKGNVNIQYGRGSLFEGTYFSGDGISSDESRGLIQFTTNSRGKYIFRNCTFVNSDHKAISGRTGKELLYKGSGIILRGSRELELEVRDCNFGEGVTYPLATKEGNFNNQVAMGSGNTFSPSAKVGKSAYGDEWASSGEPDVVEYDWPSYWSI